MERINMIGKEIRTHREEITKLEKITNSHKDAIADLKEEWFSLKAEEESKE